MLVTIEGPDLSGKTTLFKRLQAEGFPAVYVGSSPSTPELLAVMHHIEAKAAFLWDCLYDPSKLYVSDRSVFVTGRVYGAVRGRPYLVDWRKWLPEVFVLYLDVPIDELERRYAVRGDDTVLVEELALQKLGYESVLPDYRHLRVPYESDALPLLFAAVQTAGLFPPGVRRGCQADALHGGEAAGCSDGVAAPFTAGGQYPDAV